MKANGLYPGWRVVGAAFLAMSVAFGSLYAFTAFFTALSQEFAADRATVSLIFSVSGFLFFAVGALSGSLADRFGPKRVVGAGIASIAAGFFLASRADSLPAVFVTYGLGVGLGVGFVYVPAIGTVQRWFDRRRGLASGIAVSGIGVGTLAMPPLAAVWIEQLGWRGTFTVFAAIVLVLGLAAATLLEHSPEQRGLQREGAEPKTEQDQSVAAIEGDSLRTALRSRPFWLLYCAGIATTFGIYIPIVHLTPFVVDQGLPEAFGATLVGLIGLGSVAGRFAFGGTADRIGRRKALGIMFVGMGVMLLVWLFAQGKVWLTLFALLFGTFYGGFVALIPALTADYFGRLRVSGIIGFLYTSSAFGALLGPVVAGAMYDASGTYAWPIIFGAGANAIACLLLVMTMEPAQHRQLAIAAEE